MKIVSCSWFTDNITGSWPLNNPELNNLPLPLRRKLTPLGRKTLQVVNKCSAMIGNDSIPWIVSSRCGDVGRRLSLLSNLAQGEMLSPIDFSLSVHNAIIGLFSIATGNQQMHSALASGVNSFQVGLLESIALIKEKGGSVGYVYYDYHEVNKFINQLDGNEQLTCIALILSEGDGELTIRYNTTGGPQELNNYYINELLDYLKNDEKEFRISVGGGEILFARTLSKT